MVQALMVVIIVFVLVACFVACSMIYKRNTQQESYDNDVAQASWQNATKVRDLISLYLDVLLVHGPDSEEAKAFRFGVDNSELWNGNDALEIFVSMTNICDDAVRRHKSWEKYNKL